MEKPEISEKHRKVVDRDYGNDRTERLSVRLSKQEKAWVQEMADAVGKSVPDFTRSMMISAYKSGRWRKS